KEPVNEILLSNAIFALIELEAIDQAKKFFDLPYSRINALQDALKPLKSIELPLQMGKWECRCLHYRMRQALQKGEMEALSKTYATLETRKISKSLRSSFDAIELWRCLLMKDFK